MSSALGDLRDRDLRDPEVGSFPVVPRPRISEPTGQRAIVLDAAGDVWVRLEGRWHRAGGPTSEGVLWPAVQGVALLDEGEAES